MTTETPISLASIVRASDQQVSSDLAGESVLLSLETARYFGLPGVGSRIWELLRAPVRVSDICAAITSEYDVTPERCEADTLDFLRRLLEKGLLEVRGGV